MRAWDLLLNDAALASVLPDEYAHFRRPIAGALAIFLDGLAAGHQAGILADQAALNPTATAPERLAALARSCPALHKLGQVLARDRRLSAELLQHLQQLESLPPSIPWDVIDNLLTRELGSLDRLGITVTPPALAEASVAVVVPFRRVAAEQAEGVFKLLKPGIEDRLAQELDLLERVGAYLDEKCDDFQIPHLDYQDTFQQVREKLQHEVLLDLEQRHLAQAQAFYKSESRVQIPRLYEYCTPRVTAMERVMGEKITNSGLQSSCDNDKLARLTMEALIGRPIFLRSSPALFHGDPHPGNLFRTRDGRLAILDWSLVGALGEPERVALVQILLGALTYDAGQILGNLEGLSRRQPDRGALKLAVDGWLCRLGNGYTPSFTWLMGLLDEAVQTARLAVGPDLLLFRKSLHTLQGVLADLDAEDRHMDEVLLGQFLFHLAVEWPQRWLVGPHCREFSTRLSTIDLARLILGIPWTATRFWLDQMRPWRH
jgi:ubiquinone biosynthesis protein